jgi:hypothetical protein
MGVAAAAAAVFLSMTSVAVAASPAIYSTGYRVDAIGRANLDGTGVDAQFLPAKSPGGVAVDASHVYWTNYDTDTIGRANLDGTGVQQSFIAGARYPCGVAVSEAATAGAERGSHRRHRQVHHPPKRSKT